MKILVTVTPAKDLTTETNSVPTNERPPAEITENSKPVETPVSFPSFPVNFSSNLIYPPVYPPLDMSIPPPNMPAISSVLPLPPHNIGTPNSIRHISPSATARPTFQPYTYPPNLSYFPRTPGPPYNNQRAYYPP